MATRCATQRARRARVELQLHRGAGVRQHRELGALVRCCVSRIERELGEVAHWSVTIAPSAGAFASVVSIHDSEQVLASEGVGLDGALAVWDAMCKLEGSLRATRAKRTAETAKSAESAAARPPRASLVSGGGRAG